MSELLWNKKKPGGPNKNLQCTKSKSVEFPNQSITSNNCRGFINVLSRRATGFQRRAKLFELNFDRYKINFPTDGQTRWAKTFSQLVNLSGAQALNETPVTIMK